MTELRTKLRITLNKMDCVLEWLRLCSEDELFAADIANVKGELGMLRNRLVEMIEQLEVNHDQGIEGTSAEHTA